MLIACVVVFTLTAAVIDVRTRRLPNWLTVSAFVAALVFHTVTGGLVGLGGSLAGFAVGFSILLVLWLIGGGGGGDVKLMGAVGAWMGWRMTFAVFLLSTCFAVLGSILMMTVLAAKHGVKHVKRRHGLQGRDMKTTGKQSEEARLHQKQKRRLLPYALPVALSVWLVLAYQVIAKH